MGEKRKSTLAFSVNFSRSFTILHSLTNDENIFGTIICIILCEQGDVRRAWNPLIYIAAVYMYVYIFVIYVYSICTYIGINYYSL